MNHRFRDLLDPPTLAPTPAAFVPCPAFVSPGLVMAAPSFVAGVYEAARAMAAAQAQPARRPIPAFSRN